MAADVICDLGKDAVLGIDGLTVEMDKSARGKLRAFIFEFGADELDRRGFTGSRFSIYKDVRGCRSLECRSKNLCDGIDLIHTVREFFWAVTMP